jgi:hypothetical protein
MGISAALIAMLMAITGALLNHTQDFGFGSSHVQSDWVLDWYGIEAPGSMHSFPVGDRYITLMGEHLYLNRRELEGSYRQLAGAVQSNDSYVVATGNDILLLTLHGELIEHLRGKDGVPAGIRQIGVDAMGAVVVRNNYELYRADQDFIRWTRWDGEAATIEWAVPAQLEAKLRTSLQHHFRGEVLPIERVLLDLHSGRFFGQLGPWIFDAAAVLLLLLSLSGTWIWLKRRR